MLDTTAHNADRQPLLRARGLTKEFPSTDPPTRVLHGIDLDVADGEFLAVMGASGAGKSTLLYTLSAMDRPTSGTVELEGEPMQSLDDTRMSRIRLTRMGFVFQQPHFLGNLSIRDNILLPALKAGIRDADQRVDLLLGRFGIAAIGGHGVTEASGGQLQRASLCRALVCEPAILFADEPTGALNSTATIDVLDALVEAHATGVTIVMVTHDPVCAARAERLVYLRDGRIVDSVEQGPWNPDEAQQRESRMLTWLATKDF
ncbi:putative ABC transporter ATP-binding protein YknY [Acidipropionibacterium virtanenii]|uniref:Putative ABC transporter ATP-binding protein YknY n=2 Tax=Acidipropionibacterium virtanenii TaxID=2057246 RepID=A0A344UVW6_9ACTN|nr:putative ABC transporter ATP-binding protein YknY [Acidipropionibacterium virtanenii]